MAEIFDGDNKTKVIAFYLPQYHAIPENDRAWGKGFTEWTNVKKSVPYFKGHYQPRIPLNNNYYNLMNSASQEWQSNLAQKYGVFGFCYYHYWFKDGKMLLEKPAENMLVNKNITEPFCFCWANENWSKTWTGNSEDLIAVQDYGGREEWKKHFEYLLPFFKDDRYITWNGRPVFVFYKPELIPDFKEMVEFLRECAVEEGFPGLEIMIQYPSYLYSEQYDESIYDHYIDFEPLFTTYTDSLHSAQVGLKQKITKLLGTERVAKLKKLHEKPTIFDYDKIWQEILDRKYPNSKFLYGGFPDWDNSPRKKRSYVYYGASPAKFGNYIEKLINKAKKNSIPNLMFINAWNEWGEGAYLEPDEKYRYAYLEEICKRVKNEKNS